MNEHIKDFYIYKFAKENPLGLAHILKDKLSISLDEALRYIDKFMKEVNQ